MKTTKMLAILVLVLASVANGSQYLTVNNQNVASITLEAGQSCTIEVVSDNSDSYVEYVGFDNGLVLGNFLHLETKPEAGDLASVTEYHVPSFYGYCVVAAGMSPPPSPGVHFVFRYEAQQFGETDVRLYNETFASVINSVHITVIPASMGTGFTYQGRLMDGNTPADGQYDFQFKLYNHPDAGIQQGGTIDVNDLGVIDGHFTVELDFCALSAVRECGIFNGDALWLEIGVRQAQDPFGPVPPYTILSPRQELTPTPYALYAQRAAPGHSLDAADGSPAEAVYVDNDGKVGIGTKTPEHKLDVVGNARIRQDIYEGLLKLSDKYLGKTETAINSDKVDGYHAGNASGQVAVNNGTVCVNLNADKLDGYQAGNASGQVAVSNGTICVNLNADKLDGYHASSFVMPGDDYGRSGVSSTLYEGTTTLTDKYVNESGDSMNGSTSGTVLSVTNTGSGRAVEGLATNSGDLTNYGGYFVADGITGRAVYGKAGDTANVVNYGGYFEAGGQQGRGVYGEASGSSGFGVCGKASGPVGVGVYGEASSTNDMTGHSGGHFVADGKYGYGVYAVAKGYSGRGVWGSTLGVEAHAIHGNAHGSNGVAVYGWATVDGAVTNYGGYFKAAGDSGYGVYGYGKGYDFYAAGPGTDYGSSSSIRWKRNIKAIDNPLEKILQLRGVYFDWDAEHGGEHDVGMVAEEVGKVLPEIVSYEENGTDATGMDYSKLTPLLVEAVKALKADVDEQQKQAIEKDAVIKGLQEEVAVLKNLINENLLNRNGNFFEKMNK